MRQARKPTIGEIALITRGTRRADLREIATAEVLASQRSQLSPEEWNQLQAVRAQAEGRTTKVKQAGHEHDALRASVASLFERQSFCGSTRFWPKHSINRWLIWIWKP